MPRILVTDGVGLVGAYIIQALLAEITTASIKEQGTVEYTILAGYHTKAELGAAKKSALYGETVVPVLVDWALEETYLAAVQDTDAVLLLTPFTARKVDQVKSWLTAIGASTKPKHIVHVGIHTAEDALEERPVHETWQLEAEQLIASVCKPSTNLTYTFLRINFDGYNTLLKPSSIAYYVPQAVPYGWIAREDIAALAARVLLSPTQHFSKVYPLSAEAISLDGMAFIARHVTGKDVIATELAADDFEHMALAAMPGDDGYAAYVKSVASMFRLLREGKAAWHQETFTELFEGVVGRKPLAFRQWLEDRPTMRSRLSA
jgi:uncharacterized protein YbjT (DUF2867 family)